MPKLTFTQGVSASGKSTWAEQYIKDNPNTVNINRDDIRFALFNNGVKDWGKYKFKRNNENKVTEMQQQLIFDATQEDKDIIISDTNLNKKYIDKIKSLSCLRGYDFEIKQFPITLEEALIRDARRFQGVGSEEIHKQWKQWCNTYHGENYHKHDGRLSEAVIFDVDGTLALMNDRSPFEWDRVGEDFPNSHVVTMCKAFTTEGYNIIIMSGRDSCCQEETNDWLVEYLGFDDFYLFMRTEGDFRKDTVVKKELFDKYVEGNFNVISVFDDRPSVCRMWRDELGLEVVQIGNPYIEF